MNFYDAAALDMFDRRRAEQARDRREAHAKALTAASAAAQDAAAPASAGRHLLHRMSPDGRIAPARRFLPDLLNENTQRAAGCVIGAGRGHDPRRLGNLGLQKGSVDK